MIILNRFISIFEFRSCYTSMITASVKSRTKPESPETQAGCLGTHKDTYQTFVPERVLGQGCFGTVYLARICHGPYWEHKGSISGTCGTLPPAVTLARNTNTNSKTFVENSTCSHVAIKKVLQDRRYKNRELQLMLRVSHPNFVSLHQYYYTREEKSEEVYLNLVLEFVPETIQHFYKSYLRSRQLVPDLYLRLFSYQLLRAMLYLHSPEVNICHRDVKPHNVLVNPTTGELKLCDLGSAKQLDAQEPNVAYICSRYYRAPELILGATQYTTAVDLWSVGCVIAELVLRRPLFMGDNSESQFVEIVKILGLPTAHELKAMGASNGISSMHILMNGMRKKGVCGAKSSWRELFPPHISSDLVDLIARLLLYSPSHRILPADALCLQVFDGLRNSSSNLPSGIPIPSLSNFQIEEIRCMSEAHLRKLVVRPPQ